MKKLLIAMGDSWTMGHGAYDPTLLEKYKNQEITSAKLFLGSYKTFIDYSWPVQLAKHFDWDISFLAEAGASNSGQVKRLLGPCYENYTTTQNANQPTHNGVHIRTEKVQNIDFTKYDKVYLIWMLTSPWRFSFYKNKGICNIIPTSVQYDSKTGQRLSPSTIEEYNLGMKYAEFTSDENDHLLETAFYLRVVKNFCQIHNINFYYGSIVDSGLTYEPFFYESGSFLNYKYNLRKIVEADKNNIAHCGHPNQQGYNLLSSLLIESLTPLLGNT